MSATTTCGCGCNSMTTVTKAAEPCGCGCECCGAPPQTIEEQIAELEQLRASVDRRLKFLENSKV